MRNLNRPHLLGSRSRPFTASILALFTFFGAPTFAGTTTVFKSPEIFHCSIQFPIDEDAQVLSKDYSQLRERLMQESLFLREDDNQNQHLIFPAYMDGAFPLAKRILQQHTLTAQSLSRATNKHEDLSLWIPGVYWNLKSRNFFLYGLTTGAYLVARDLRKTGHPPIETVSYNCETAYYAHLAQRQLIEDRLSLITVVANDLVESLDQDILAGIETVHAKTFAAVTSHPEASKKYTRCAFVGLPKNIRTRDHLRLASGIWRAAVESTQSASYLASALKQNSTLPLIFFGRLLTSHNKVYRAALQELLAAQEESKISSCEAGKKAWTQFLSETEILSDKVDFVLQLLENDLDHELFD